jgi:hypothetical protein
MKLRRNTKYKIAYEQKNNTGGSIDLTTKSIYFNVKENQDDVSYLYQVMSDTAGGSGEITFAGNMFFVEVILDSTFTEQVYYWDVYVDEIEEIIYNGVITLEKTNYNALHSVSNSMVLTKFYEATIDGDGLIIESEKTGFGTINVARSSEGIYLITSDEEFSNNVIIEVQTTDRNKEGITFEHKTGSQIYVRCYDSLGNLFDTSILISIKKY